MKLPFGMFRDREKVVGWVGGILGVLLLNVTNKGLALNIGNDLLDLVAWCLGNFPLGLLGGATARELVRPGNVRNKLNGLST